jgi:hypothetical protein
MVLAGIGGMTLALRPAVPVWRAVAAWTVGAWAWAALCADLADDAAEGTTGPGGADAGVAQPGRRARTGMGIGVGGAAVAAGVGITVAFAAAAAAGVPALLLTHLLPDTITSAPPPVPGRVPAPAPGAAPP